MTPARPMAARSSCFLNCNFNVRIAIVNSEDCADRAQALSRGAHRETVLEEAPDHSREEEHQRRQAGPRGRRPRTIRTATRLLASGANRDRTAAVGFRTRTGAI